ncbi:MAG TPA: ATP-binding protein [Cyclobacteriaceae bacterium]|nr:transporter substrate-binding domain-containing protein [Cyclobacteriaceae bacterium]HMV07379.1 ATP-binding protein [Cyclobacteriaceae bacterium]HMW99266.1 ATP-binding protein [Cyclobacteriaceae bacterium]HMX48945.1 ATP-binding protein [Cyclobacteriaceae bacterium]HMY94604.1 ATP-binding protein [Cyclobacteriaceae bacterium]
MKRTLPVIILLTCSLIAAVGQSSAGKLTWAEAQKTKKATLYIYWYESRPFIYRNENGQMEGIEQEILTGFKDYVKEKYHVDVTLQWKETQNFENTYLTVCNEQLPGAFGVSAFSITQKRKERVKFTLPYMPDISVVISSKNIPIVQNGEEFDKIFSGLEAITIKGTTYEEDLHKLKAERGIDFKMRYVPSYQNILATISGSENAFGVIDLPTYMVDLNKNAGMSVNRQNIVPFKREGLAFITPLNSDWGQPVDEYLSGGKFQLTIDPIMGKYLDHSVYNFMEDLANAADNEVMLLTFEKEIQHRDQQGKSEQILRESIFRNILTASITVVLIFLVIIFLLYRKQNKINQQLTNQKKEIEDQRINIENQNAQLERRNEQLSHLNEEKNNLIKILAHDLRTPINQVQGLAQLLLIENPTFGAEQKDSINRIIDSSIRLNTMIGKILDVDAIEGNRINMQLEAIDMNVLTKRVVSSFERIAAKKDIQLTFTSASGPMVVKGDMLYMTEIIENLISNAIKFSEWNKKVMIALGACDVNVQLKVQDEGPGLTEEDKQKIFQKFQRLSARPTAGEYSTGLGLSIVKKYTELMNGQIRYESTEGVGTSFYLEFPKV